MTCFFFLVIGGLLSAHLLAQRAGLNVEENWPCQGPLLRLAVDAAERLLPGLVAFKLFNIYKSKYTCRIQKAGIPIYIYSLGFWKLHLWSPPHLPQGALQEFSPKVKKASGACC